MKASLCAGLTRVKRLQVDSERTIGFMGEEGRVNATPCLVGDIEGTCRELILEYADPGEDSVGMEVSIQHLAPALPGTTVEIAVTARADLRRVGVAQKCTFCSDRIDFGLANGLVPGVHPDATPACVNACIADALHFGDLDDPDSNVSRLLREQRHFRMHEELGTEPAFHYLYGRADGPDEGSLLAPPPEPGHLRTRGVEPAHQRHWDWKAAGNCICGGAGSAFYLWIVFAAVEEPAVHHFAWSALALVALGLLLVLLKIARPLRAASVLLQPQRSWMAREAWVALALLPLAAAATA